MWGVLPQWEPESPLAARSCVLGLCFSALALALGSVGGYWLSC